MTKYTMTDLYGEHTITDKEILDRFYVDWSEYQDKKLGFQRDRTNDITRCITDWLEIHYEYEKTPD